MNAVLVAVLLIAAQASSGSYTLATLRPAAEVAMPPIPQKRGARLGEMEELGPIITAQSAVVIDVASGAVLFGKQPYVVRPLASITKLLTALTVVSVSPDWGASLEVGAADIPPEGHTVFQPGDRATAEDLFTAMLVRSDNGAARTLVRGVGTAEGWFPIAAAARAHRVGLSSLRVSEPSGLAVENRGTAVDAARLLRAAMAERIIAERLRMSRATITVVRRTPTRIPITSTNMLLRDGIAHAFDVQGGKTGYLDESGYNLALSVARGGHEVIVVVLGSAGHEERFRDARLLADWTFQNYVWTSSTSSSGSGTSASPR
ncbi:MAG: serine hydrolase [bacterium]|nr:serine hydrolase [bacterium]